jgi:hypothetical protein
MTLPPAPAVDAETTASTTALTEATEENTAGGVAATATAKSRVSVEEVLCGRVGTFHYYFAVKTPIDDSRYSPCNQSDTRE